MKQIAEWLETPLRLLPWWHSLLLGTVGGFLIGISVGILVTVLLSQL